MLVLLLIVGLCFALLAAAPWAFFILFGVTMIALVAAVVAQESATRISSHVVTADQLRQRIGVLKQTQENMRALATMARDLGHTVIAINAECDEDNARRDGAELERQLALMDRDNRPKQLGRWWEY